MGRRPRLGPHLWRDDVRQPVRVGGAPGVGVRRGEVRRGRVVRHVPAGGRQERLLALRAEQRLPRLLPQQGAALGVPVATPARSTPNRCCICSQNGDGESNALSECPANQNMRNCYGVAIGSLCEGDGECGTANGLNNCGWWDIYRRVGVPRVVPQQYTHAYWVRWRTDATGYRTLFRTGGPRLAGRPPRAREGGEQRARLLVQPRRQRLARHGVQGRHHPVAARRRDGEHAHAVELRRHLLLTSATPTRRRRTAPPRACARG